MKPIIKKGYTIYPPTGRGRKPQVVFPRKRNLRPLPDINDFIVQVAGELDILREKLKQISKSLELVTNKPSLEIYCGSMRKFKSYYEPALKACDRGKEKR